MLWKSLSLLGVSALCGSLLGCSKSSAAELARERVFVSNEDAGSVDVIETQTRRVAGHIAVGKRPRGIRSSSDGKTLYVALSGSPKGGPNIDESQLPPPDRNADGIGVIDVSARRLLRVLPSGPDPEAFDLVQNRLFVANEDAGRASIINAQSGRVEASLTVGVEPEGVTARPDGRVVYVTSEADGSVHVIDTRTQTVVARVAVGQRPRAVAFSFDGSKAYVTNELSSSISVIDARAHHLEQTLQLPAGSRPMGIVLAPDGEHAYVTTGRAGSLVEVELRGPSVQRTLANVGARPWGIGISKDGRHLYVANGPSHDVADVDVGAWRVTERIVVGGSPWGIAVVEGGSAR